MSNFLPKIRMGPNILFILARGLENPCCAQKLQWWKWQLWNVAPLLDAMPPPPQKKNKQRKLVVNPILNLSSIEHYSCQHWKGTEMTSGKIQWDFFFFFVILQTLIYHAIREGNCRLATPWVWISNSPEMPQGPKWEIAQKGLLLLGFLVQQAQTCHIP